MSRCCFAMQQVSARHLFSCPKWLTFSGCREGGERWSEEEEKAGCGRLKRDRNKMALCCAVNLGLIIGVSVARSGAAWGGQVKLDGEQRRNCVGLSVLCFYLATAMETKSNNAKHSSLELSHRWGVRQHGWQTSAPMQDAESFIKWCF